MRSGGSFFLTCSVRLRARGHELLILAEADARLTELAWKAVRCPDFHKRRRHLAVRMVSLQLTAMHKVATPVNWKNARR